MKNNKKLKLEKLNFFVIDTKYINFLSQFDSHVAYNKDETRPYIGIVLRIEKHCYFAPLFSPKSKHKTYKNNLSFFKIVSKKSKNSLGIIRFSNMIPVPEDSMYLLELEDKSYGYKRLLSEQYSYINIPENRQKIKDKAEKIYAIVTSKSKSRMSQFYKSLSCDFKRLEEKCLNFQK